MPKQFDIQVRRVAGEDPGRESYTVIGPDQRVIEPIDTYLSFLTNIEKSPNTVRAYGHDMADYWRFLLEEDAPWDKPTVDRMAEYVSWLRRPAGNVVVLTGEEQRLSKSTVNRKLSVLMGFYEYHQRRGCEFSKAVIDYTRSGRGSYKPFLHGIAKSTPRGQLIRLRDEQRLPKTLTLRQVAAIIQAQVHLRDKLLFALPATTGIRIGQGLGIRHEDVASWDQRLDIVHRDDNANGARGKGGKGSVPLTRDIVRLHSEYLHEEYGSIDSDYLFVNLWEGDIGAAMTYPTAHDLVLRTRSKVGFYFSFHMLRHTFATVARRGGVSLDALSRLLTHRSPTSVEFYLHATVDDLRAELNAAGWLDAIEDLL